jgi:hypothetical protein
MTTSTSNRARAISPALLFIASLAAAIALLSVALHARSNPVSPEKPTTASAGAAATPTFYRDVAPILQHHCEICHRADGIAPMPLQTYSQARAYAAAIAASAKSKSMPPWFAVPVIGHFSNDPSLTENQIATLAAWSAAGAPAGIEKDAPPPIHWSNPGPSPSPTKFSR